MKIRNIRGYPAHTLFDQNGPEKLRSNFGTRRGVTAQLTGNSDGTLGSKFNSVSGAVVVER